MFKTNEVLNVIYPNVLSEKRSEVFLMAWSGWPNGHLKQVQLEVLSNELPFFYFVLMRNTS